VEEIFENLSECVLRHTFTANEMYHLGMTGNEVIIVPPKPVCVKGIKQVDSVTSGEIDKYVTANVAVNAIGKHVPPELIFPRGDLKNHALTGAPTASIVGANPTDF
jgi:hypothetical protein